MVNHRLALKTIAGEGACPVEPIFAYLLGVLILSAERDYLIDVS
jgi:hypothetical protein